MFSFVPSCEVAESMKPCGASGVQHAARNLAQLADFKQIDVALVNANQTLILESPQHTTDRLGCKTQMIGNIASRHAESEARRRESS
jgi:hypothetical protein